MLGLYGIYCGNAVKNILYSLKGHCGENELIFQSKQVMISSSGSNNFTFKSFLPFRENQQID